MCFRHNILVDNAGFGENYVSLRATKLVADCSGIACGIREARLGWIEAGISVVMVANKITNARVVLA